MWASSENMGRSIDKVTDYYYYYYYYYYYIVRFCLEINAPPQALLTLTPN